MSLLLLLSEVKMTGCWYTVLVAELVVAVLVSISAFVGVVATDVNVMLFS